MKIILYISYKNNEIAYTLKTNSINSSIMQYSYNHIIRKKYIYFIIIFLI